MRAVRGCLLAVVMTAASGVLGRAVLAPLADGWRALDPTSSRSAGSPAAELQALLVGACALLLAVTWLWLMTAVGVTTWDLLRRRSAPRCSHEAPRPSVFRPPLLRTLVATCLGATALTMPSGAHAGSPVRQVNDAPRDLARASTGALARGPVVTGRHLLAGLPVPDRTTGRLTEAGSRQPDRRLTRLHVAPGDCLWTLTAELLPPGVPESTVADGWHLLYAANRTVVGPDPDLLRPGLALHVDEALLDLVRTAAGPAPRPVPSPVPGGSR